MDSLRIYLCLEPRLAVNHVGGPHQQVDNITVSLLIRYTTLPHSDWVLVQLEFAKVEPRGGRTTPDSLGLHQGLYVS